MNQIAREIENPSLKLIVKFHQKIKKGVTNFIKKFFERLRPKSDHKLDGQT